MLALRSLAVMVLYPLSGIIRKKVASDGSMSGQASLVVVYESMTDPGDRAFELNVSAVTDLSGSQHPFSILSATRSHYRNRGRFFLGYVLSRLLQATQLPKYFTRR